MLKAYFPADAVRIERAYAIPSWLSAASVQLELLVGFWLLSGCQATIARVTAISLFSLFALFSLYPALSGSESCGCFGEFAVNPWLTLLVDLTVITVLTAWRPIFGTSRWRLPSAVAAYAILAFFVGIPRLPHRLPHSLAIEVETESFIVLDPHKWIGEEFPLSDFCSPKVELQSGEWTVLLYHHDCAHCQEAVPKYEALAEQWAGRGQRVLLVETPPYGEPIGALNSVATRVRLAENREWFVQMPVEILLKEGKVVNVRSEL